MARTFCEPLNCIAGNKIVISPLCEQSDDASEVVPIVRQIDVESLLKERELIPESVEKLICYYTPCNTRDVGVEMRILMKNERSVYQTVRKLSPLERKVVNEQVAEWMEQGVVRLSLSEYANPMVLARKKDGEYRLCVNYRLLNRNILRDCYPLHLIEDQLDRLQGSMFSAR